MVHFATVPMSFRGTLHSIDSPYTLRIGCTVISYVFANQGITSKSTALIHGTLSFSLRKFATMHPQTTVSEAYLSWAEADIMLASTCRNLQQDYP